MAIYFITFGGGTPNYKDAVKRICKQAERFNLFTEIFGYTDEDLKNDPDFWKQHGDFIQANAQGYGFWIWKIYLLQKLMRQDKYKEGDIFFYVDAGCEMNLRGKLRFKEYIKLVEENDTLAMRLETFSERKYTKMDLLKYVNASDEVIESDQIEGGILFIKKTKQNMEMLDEIYQIQSSCNYHFIDNTESISPNSSEFKEHRHDQSVISLMFKKYNRYSIPDETYFYPDWMKGLKYPIWAIRNRTGEPYITF